MAVAIRYAAEDFEVVEVEKPFTGEIRNPDTGRPSQTFEMAGKVDAIVRRPDGLYLLEHKTAASIDGNYLDKLWTDTQMRTKPHPTYEAGDRTGRLPDILPLDYDAFVQAFASTAPVTPGNGQAADRAKPGSTLNGRIQR